MEPSSVARIIWVARRIKDPRKDRSGSAMAAKAPTKAKGVTERSRQSRASRTRNSILCTVRGSNTKLGSAACEWFRIRGFVEEVRGPTRGVARPGDREGSARDSLPSWPRGRGTPPPTAAAATLRRHRPLSAPPPGSHGEWVYSLQWIKGR